MNLKFRIRVLKEKNFAIFHNRQTHFRFVFSKSSKIEKFRYLNFARKIFHKNEKHHHHHKKIIQIKFNLTYILNYI